MRHSRAFRIRSVCLRRSGRRRGKGVCLVRLELLGRRCLLGGGRNLWPGDGSTRCWGDCRVRRSAGTVLRRTNSLILSRILCRLCCCRLLLDRQTLDLGPPVGQPCAGTSPMNSASSSPRNLANPSPRRCYTPRQFHLNSPVLEPNLHIPLRHPQLHCEPLPQTVVRLRIDVEPMLQDLELLGCCSATVFDLYGGNVVRTCTPVADTVSGRQRRQSHRTRRGRRPRHESRHRGHFTGLGRRDGRGVVVQDVEERGQGGEG